MKNTYIPDINRIIKIIGICFLAMLVVINIPHFALTASVKVSILFVVLITPFFFILRKKYLTAIDEAFRTKNLPAKVFNNPIGLCYLKKQLLSKTEFRVIKSLSILNLLSKKISLKLYNELAQNSVLKPYLIPLLPLEELTVYLNEENLVLKQIALEKLLNSSNDSHKEIASTHLKSLITSSDAALKIMGARIIGNTKKTDFLEYLVTLFDDSDVKVKRIALITAGKCGDESFVPHIINALKTDYLFYDACKALACFAPNLSFEILNEALSSIPYPFRKTFLQNLAASKSKHITNFLVFNLNKVDLLTKRIIINCLAELNLTANNKIYPQIKTCLYDLTNSATWILSAISDIAARFETSELKRILKYEFDLTKEAVFNLLPLIVPSAKNLINLASDEKLDKNHLANEELAKVLPEEIKIICMPLIEHLSLQERAIRLKPHFHQSSTDFENRLVAIFTADTDKNLFLSRAYAIVTAVELNSPIFLNYFKQALDDQAKAVVETAAWAINQASIK